jgi:hypothetical protein
MRTKLAVFVLLALLMVGFVGPMQPAKACFEGCTPGFWKNHQSVPPWPTQICVEDSDWNWMFPMSWDKCTTVLALGPDPWNFLVQDIFTLPLLVDGNGDLDLNGDGNPDTLLDALNYGGGPDLAGKARNLLRQAVASLLNSGTMAHKPAYSIIQITNNVLSNLCQHDWCQYQYWYDTFTANNEQGSPVCPD